MSLFKAFEANTQGQDFVVGDIHGNFSLLWKMLDEIKFDRTKDRLFSVGDLVDRGPESECVLEWLNYPWFHAVKGNHEDLAIKHAAGFGQPDHVYAGNGGQWFLDLDQNTQQVIAAELERLPMAIEVNLGDGKAGIVHAEVPGDDWADFRNKLETGWRPIDFLEHFALWGRDIIRYRSRLPNDWSGVANVDVVYVGHSVVPEITEIANIRYIDTGAFRRGKGALTIMNMHTGQSYNIVDGLIS